MAILAVLIAALVAFFVTRDHGDPARHLIEREAGATKP